MKHLARFKFIDAVARAASIRKVADILAITSTALNRSILAFEEELGVAIFERYLRDVRLSSAGELIICSIRALPRYLAFARRFGMSVWLGRYGITVTAPAA